MLEYECPECESTLIGEFGDEVYCDKCNITYATEWDYFGYGNPKGWITGPSPSSEPQ